MSRFLLVVPPLVGHINPLVGVAAELVERGHEVAWVGVPELVRGLSGEHATVFPADAGDVTKVRDRPAGLRGMAALRVLWTDLLVPMADFMAPGVRAAIEEFVPDVMVCDQQAMAGGLLAELLGLPWATSASTPTELTTEYLPGVESWIAEQVDGLRERIGDPKSKIDPRFSPDLVLAFTTQALTGSDIEVGEQVRFVGPSIGARPLVADFPWERLDPARRKVLISLGTANPAAVERFLTVSAEAALARSSQLQAVIVDPSGALGEPGDNVIVRPKVPQLSLLPHLDAVVCHAGHNTVCESLWHGLPLVVAPIRDDQGDVASKVVEAGAGIRLRFTRATDRHVGDAIDRVLNEQSYHEAAQRIQRSFRAAGGSVAAAEHLERLSRKQHAVASG
ncbi:glycosyl transferase [Longimycelium tulufanense]|uniref:Glycosyl transferase n=1 Tax=Longimycelium tulufanense TaxID=907463 RepID=A0A8J3CF20_9PSEU|nr:glycosyltransferase [Longimycelium tulufanense]GGM51063.1 glycosyl transferase [Longimycelium tulufanense]